MELRFPSPGLRAQSATLGIDTKRDSNAVGVAFSRRRYPQQDNGLRCVGGVLLNSICNILPNPCSPSCATGNALGWLVTAVTRSRIVCHVPTYRLSRAHVSIVTCPRFIRYEPPMMVAGDAHRPTKISRQPKAPPQPSPRGGGSFLLYLRHLRGTPAPWGGLGRGFRRAGEGPPFTQKTGEPTVTVGIPG